MSKKIHYLTPEGLEKLKIKLGKLQENRARIIQRIKEAKEIGDLSENAEYQTAREAHALNETQIQEIENLLKRAVLVQKRSNSQTVSIGSRVTLKQGMKRKVFTIVGSEESDPSNGFISYESPLGNALLGKRVGDEVTIKNLLDKKIVYKILKIE